MVPFNPVRPGRRLRTGSKDQAYVNPDSQTLMTVFPYTTPRRGPIILRPLGRFILLLQSSLDHEPIQQGGSINPSHDPILSRENPRQSSRVESHLEIHSSHADFPSILYPCIALRTRKILPTRIFRSEAQVLRPNGLGTQHDVDGRRDIEREGQGGGFFFLPLLSVSLSA